MKQRVAETLSVPQLYRAFPDDSSCRKWLEGVRWRGEPVCPHCGGLDDVKPPPPSKPSHYWCKSCRKHFTATTSTCLHSTKIPLQVWMFAIYSVLTARKGVSSLQLGKELGITQKSAWFMLQRMREACDKGQFKIGGVVEVDETYIGGKRKNMSTDKRKALKEADAGRGTVGKAPVVGVRERGGRTFAKPVQKTDSATLIPFVEDSVEPGSTVYIDDAAAYGALPTVINQFCHDTVNPSASEYVRGDVHTNGMESVWAVLERSITGVFHKVRLKPLARYVNETTFRLNVGKCAVDTIDRMAAMAFGIENKRLRYEALIADNGLPSLARPAS